MTETTLIVGIDQVKNWTADLTVKGVLDVLGQNSGNIMFTESLSQSLADSKKTNFSIPDSALDGVKTIVVAAANWMNSYEDYNWLADRLEAIGLPIVLVGIGAQPGSDGGFPAISPGTLRLLKVASKGSSIISVRGKFSLETLHHYGFDNALATGCPSMLLAASKYPLSLNPPTADDVILHSTRHGFNVTLDNQRWLYSEALRLNTSILLQSEHPDIYCALGKLYNAEINAKCESILTKVYSGSTFEQIKAYLLAKGFFATSYDKWIERMGGFTFAAGTRIHGSVSALLAGVPSLLLTHDSRTLELAQSLSIPSCPLTDLDMSNELSIDRLLEIYDKLPPPLLNYSQYLSAFVEFFEANGLRPSNVLRKAVSIR